MRERERERERERGREGEREGERGIRAARVFMVKNDSNFTQPCLPSPSWHKMYTN